MATIPRAWWCRVSTTTPIRRVFEAIMAGPTVATEWAPRVLSIVRVAVALIFMEHGTQKLFGFPPSANPGPALFSLYGLAGTLEIVGGILLAFGLFTRPV